MNLVQEYIYKKNRRSFREEEELFDSYYFQYFQYKSENFLQVNIVLKL